jgi:hypothetical protein
LTCSTDFTDRDIHRSGSFDSTNDIINPDSGTHSIRDHGKKEFLHFVMENYRLLLSSESKKIGGKSTISVFCRMDIGIMFDEDGRASYFINEIERTPTTSLWAKNDSVPIRTLSATFGECFYNWVTDVLQ